jgi:uncharacterized repeat protein (TIGR03803 family)
MVLIATLLAAPLFFSPVAPGSTEMVIHRFQGPSDGAGPLSGPMVDRGGTLYGTTFNGTTFGELGTVYSMTPPTAPGTPWTETVLHRFFDLNDEGFWPVGGLVGDENGNIYGTTSAGGLAGFGVVFELSPPVQGSARWRYAVIHTFTSVARDGGDPDTDLAIDRVGNIYGTTSVGGLAGFGVVFELSPTTAGYVEHILHDFSVYGRTFAGVTLDARENVYGTTLFGGGQRAGTVFELSRGGSGWTYQVIYTFKGNADGAGPEADLTFGAGGDLYGTTIGGGDDLCFCGTVFRLTPRVSGEWAHTVLYRFKEKGDGAIPITGVVLNAAGAIFGTASAGGIHGTACSLECGLAYRLTPPVGGGSGRWTETVLHTFSNKGDGIGPVGNLVFGRDGLLYGVTFAGGNLSVRPSDHGYGIVFGVEP